MDWKKLCDDVAQWAEAHRDEFVKDISDVCRIRSTSRNQLDCANAPLVRPAAICWIRRWKCPPLTALRPATMTTSAAAPSTGDNPDNDSIGIVAHMDIVPENMCNLASDAGGWTHDPFDPILSEDGKYLFGRGTCDNKSCGIMALYAMRYLKEHNIKLKNNVMLVYGLNEEIGMRDMPEFLKREKQSKIYLVPDSKYPVCISESGNSRYGLESAKLEDGNLKDIWSGVSNDDWCDATVSVPSKEAYAVLSGVDPMVAQWATKFYDHTKVETLENGDVKIIVEKDEKITASARLCHVLAKCGLIKDPKTMEVLNWLDWYTSDTTGAHMGIACDDGPNAPLSIRFNYIRLIDKKKSYCIPPSSGLLWRTRRKYWQSRRNLGRFPHGSAPAPPAGWLLHGSERSPGGKAGSNCQGRAGSGGYPLSDRRRYLCSSPAQRHSLWRHRTRPCALVWHGQGRCPPGGRVL